MRIQLNHKEKGRYNQNHPAEREIGFLSERWRRRMAKESVPSSAIFIAFLSASQRVLSIFPRCAAPLGRGRPKKNETMWPHTPQQRASGRPKKAIP